ncbi:MAG: nitrous oxide reductase family maturation protein NosD [Candidatus Bathyarchaeia archaeon]
MRKPLLCLLIIFSLTTICVTLVQPIKAASKTITVPDDYATIRTAIGNASAGDTIFVKKGIYNQTVIVDKPLSLIGEDNQQTVIIGPYFGGTNTPPAVSVQANNVIVSGFNITQSWNGITIAENCTGCKITGNNIEHNFDSGILSRGQAEIVGNNITENQNWGVQAWSNNIIKDNNITGTGYPTYSSYFGDGVWVLKGNTTVQNNFISDNIAGIILGDGDSFNIVGNNITDNLEFGIKFTYSTNNVTVHHNNIELNKVGVILDYSSYTETATLGSGNVVYNNNFYNWQNVVVQHDFPVHVDFSGVVWDNGEEGNHWATYFPNSTQPNTQAITGPYIIDEANVDNHPLPNAVVVPEMPMWAIAGAAVGVTVLTVFVAKKQQRTS